MGGSLKASMGARANRRTHSGSAQLSSSSITPLPVSFKRIGGSSNVTEDDVISPRAESNGAALESPDPAARH